MLGPSPPQAWAHIMEAHEDGLWWLHACRQACFIVALPCTRCWLAEHGHALVAPPEKPIVARRGGWCPIAVELIRTRVA
jgi:hypothetical protein